jgi:general secretion pathway protein C
MKQWPLVASFLLFIALCASVAYWAMQVFTPPVRPAAAPPPTAQPAPNLAAAAGLFGGRSNLAVASNFQLKGVIFSGNPASSVAILVADGKPAQAIRANSEVVPGVTVKEVHRQYVLLSDGGVIKRVELPEDAKSEGTMAMSERAPSAPVRTAPAASSAPARTAPAAPPRVVVSPPPQGQPVPPNTGVPPSSAAAAPAPNIPQQTGNPGGVAMPPNAGTPPRMDMGGPSLGYNPAGSQAVSPSPRPPAPAPAPAPSVPPAAIPGQPGPVPQSNYQTQPVPGTPATPMQQQ